MIQVQIIQRMLEDGTEAEWCECDDLVEFLRDRYGHAPPGARLFHQYVSDATDVTPTSAEAEERLGTLPGPFYFVVQPMAELTVAAVVKFVATVAFSYALSQMMAPDVPNVAQRTVRQESPNNGLSDRVNSQRINGRIPDIYGTVRSTPDLLAQPYRVFEDHVEKEIAYMCIGRGSYEIHDVRDDTTQAADVAGMSVEVYGPRTSPNAGYPPQLRIGTPINERVVRAKRWNSINGQALQPENAGSTFRRPAVFLSPNIVETRDPNTDFSGLFVVGDQVDIISAVQPASMSVQTMGLVLAYLGSDAGTVTLEGDQRAFFWSGGVVDIRSSFVRWQVVNDLGDETRYFSYSADVSGVYPVSAVTFQPAAPGAVAKTVITVDVSSKLSVWAAFSGGQLESSEPTGSGEVVLSSAEQAFDLSGRYSVLAVTSSRLTLNAPAEVNADWTVLQNEYGGQSAVLAPSIETTGERWVDAGEVSSDDEIDELIVNLVALNGLYADDGRQQYAQHVSVLLEIQPLNADGVPQGSAQQVTGVVQGSPVTRSTRALTMRVPVAGGYRRLRIRGRRTSHTPGDFEGSVVDEVKWRDLYAVSAIDRPHFGNVTTVHAISYATDGALALKERKLNCLVTRKLPRRIDGQTAFTTELYPTRNAADIICAVALDPYIGNRELSELDVEQIYATVAEVQAYFGIEAAGEFSYTFDKTGMSFEETIAAIASAVFCQAYRRGSVLRLFFERKTEDSALLFNHRNTLPSTETRTTSFGPTEGYDGVEYSYVSPDDDAVVKLYLPDEGVINPRTIESIGVRHDGQAHLHAWRAWNKILYQHTIMERTCLQEASLLVLGERVLAADSTRAQSQDGQIRHVEGVEIVLSQSVEWKAGGSYRIYVQNSDGQTEAIPITPGRSAFHAVLGRAPRVPLVTSGVAPTRYIIGQDSGRQHAEPFIVTNLESAEGMTVPLTAINYDDRYYANDGDYR